MFLQATVPLAVALLFTKRASSTSRVVAFLFYLWMLLRTLSSGARSPLAPLLLCPVAAVFWNSSERWRRRLLWIGTPCALIVGYVLAAVIVEGRNDGRLDIEAGLSVEYTGFEMFRELLLIVKKSDEGSLKHTLGMTYFAQLVNPVPRALWPGKPVADAGLILARAVGAVDHITGEPTMTVSPGFLGEAYMNFGWFGIVLLPFLGGAIAKAWDDLLPDAAQSLPIFLVYCAGLAAILNSGRSFNLSTFYGLCALYVLVHVFGYFSSQSAIPHPHTRHVATRGGPVREM
jgi:oligosaccharide repeat unit polymerase